MRYLTKYEPFLEGKKNPTKKNQPNRKKDSSKLNEEIEVNRSAVTGAITSILLGIFAILPSDINAQNINKIPKKQKEEIAEAFKDLESFDTTLVNQAVRDGLATGKLTQQQADFILQRQSYLRDLYPDLYRQWRGDLSDTERDNFKDYIYRKYKYEERECRSMDEYLKLLRSGYIPVQYKVQYMEKEELPVVQIDTIINPETFEVDSVDSQVIVFGEEGGDLFPTGDYVMTDSVKNSIRKTLEEMEKEGYEIEEVYVGAGTDAERMNWQLNDKRKRDFERGPFSAGTDTTGNKTLAQFRADEMMEILDQVVGDSVPVKLEMIPDGGQDIANRDDFARLHIAKQKAKDRKDQKAVKDIQRQIEELREKTQPHRFAVIQVKVSKKFKVTKKTEPTKPTPTPEVNITAPKPDEILDMYAKLVRITVKDKKKPSKITTKRWKNPTPGNPGRKNRCYDM